MLYTVVLLQLGVKKSACILSINFLHVYSVEMPAGDETAAFALYIDYYTMLCKMCLYSFHLNSYRCMNELTAVNTAGKIAYI
jgi:hypothetical protein